MSHTTDNSDRHSKTKNNHRGSDDYDPFCIDEDDIAEAQSANNVPTTKSTGDRKSPIENDGRTKSESTQIIKKNSSSNHRSSTEESRNQNSHHQHRSKYSDRRSRSRSPSHRKRHRTSSNSSPTRSRRSFPSDHGRDLKNSSRNRHRTSSRSSSPPARRKTDSNESKSTNESENNFHASLNDRQPKKSSPFRGINSSSEKNPNFHQIKEQNTSQIVKTPSTNGASRSRSNLIQIVTSESPTVPKPVRLPSVIAKAEPTTNTVKKTSALVEDLLLEEEKEKVPIKSIDLESLKIPESSTKKIEKTDEDEKNNATTKTATSLVKKPYTLIKVPNANVTNSPFFQRKLSKNEISKSDSDFSTRKIDTNGENGKRTSLDERISILCNVPTEQTTPNQISTNKDERRSASSKNYTTEWIANQKPEDAPAPIEELPNFPPLTAPSATRNGVVKSETVDSNVFGKLSEVMNKFIRKQTDVNGSNNESEEIVPSSAKQLEHLERTERRKEREKLQSQIAAIAKEPLKLAFRRNLVDKDEYKTIMKKVVNKATHANEIDRNQILKMVKGYLEKYGSLRQQEKSSKKMPNSNVK